MVAHNAGAPYGHQHISLHVLFDSDSCNVEELIMLVN